jgi:hypothetical protein
MADDNQQPKQNPDDGGSTEQSGREIIPIAAAAFLGALAGAIVGSALG